MGTSLAFDHLIIIVPDLPSGVQAYSRLGFTVTPGGKHSGGATHNALVPFADGTYLELMAPTRRGALWFWSTLRSLRLLPAYLAALDPVLHPFILRVANGPGPVDYALSVDDLLAMLDILRPRGLNIDGPVYGSRQRPDGLRVQWQLGIPQDKDLPFVIKDLTPRDMRIPVGEPRRHANGVLGVQGLEVLVADLPGSARRYATLLGVDPLPTPPASPISSTGTRFDLDGTLFHLTPTSGNKSQRRRLKGLAARPQQLFLRTSSGWARFYHHPQSGPGFTPLAESEAADLGLIEGK